MLLDHSIQLGDALLRGVDEQFIVAVQMISDYIKAKNIPVSKSKMFLLSTTYVYGCITFKFERYVLNCKKIKCTYLVKY